MMEPKVLLLYTCVAIFAITGIVTLLGICNLVKIKEGFLNKLFVALLLQIVAIGIMGFKEYIEQKTCDEVIKFTTKVVFIDSTGLRIDEASEKELLDGLAKTKGITVIPDIIRNSNNFEIFIPKSFILSPQGASININMKNFKEVAIKNADLKKKLNQSKSNEIDLDSTVLKYLPRPKSAYGEALTQIPH